MFDWFKNKKDYSNVVPFPGNNDKVPTTPYVVPPAPKKEKEVTFYRIGLTDGNRVSFSMGYNEITMTAQGVDDLIEQLTVFRDQILRCTGSNTDEDEE